MELAVEGEASKSYLTEDRLNGSTVGEGASPTGLCTHTHPQPISALTTQDDGGVRPRARTCWA